MIVVIMVMAFTARGSRFTSPLKKKKRKREINFHENFREIDIYLDGEADLCLLNWELVVLWRLGWERLIL